MPQAAKRTFTKEEIAIHPEYQDTYVEMPLRKLRIVYPDNTFIELYWGTTTQGTYPRDIPMQVFDAQSNKFKTIDIATSEPALFLWQGGINK